MEAETLAPTSAAPDEARATPPRDVAQDPPPEAEAAVAAAGQEQIVINIIPDSSSQLRTSRALNYTKLAAIIKKRPRFEAFRFRRKDSVNTNNAFKPMLKMELQVASGSHWVLARRCLVAVFWLSWLSLLAVALVIIVRTPECKPTPKLRWWQRRPMYHIALQSYFDRNGDGIGDLLGIHQKLKYIKRLNIGTIIIEPFHSFMTNSSDSKSVDRRFGYINELKPLIKTATKYGLKIVLDLTPNPKGIEEYTWADINFYDENMLNDLLPPDWEGTTISSAFAEHLNALHISRRAFLEAEVSERIRRDLRHNVRPSNTVLQQGDIVYYKGDNFNEWKGSGKVIGIDGKTIVLQYGNPTVRVHSSRIMGTDYKFANLERADKHDEEQGSSETLMLQNYEDQLLEIDRFVKGHFSSVTIKRSGGIYARLFIMLLFSMPGTPIIYYGDEIGLKDYKVTTHPLMRWDDTKFAGFTKSSPWVLPDLSAYTPSVLQQKDDPLSTLSYYQKLGKIRSEEPSLQYGDFNIVSNSTSSISFIRQWERTGILVVLNFGATTTIDFTGVYLPSTALLLIQSEGLTPCGLIQMNKMKVEANTGYILKYFVEE
ncbi:amino acid transporter heavy chain SLC3A2-like [Mustelus asterias]